jgi:hypothetical protein
MKIRKIRTKKLPVSRLKPIENRFLDLRFSGLEDAINLMGDKDKQQFVHSSTGFHLRKNKALNDKDIYQSDEEFQNTYNDYEEDAIYTGKAYLKMCRKYRGKEYNYLVTVEDLPDNL